MVADGAGGVLVCWDDNRNGNSDRNLYAQHVLASGSLDPAWPPTGLELCMAAGVQWFPRMTSDGIGGAIVTWRDERNDAGDSYAQHVIATGTVDPAWPGEGRAVSTAGGAQILPAIIGDGAGGAIIAWDDLRSGAGEFGVDDDIYVQHVRGNGQLGDEPVHAPDGAGLALALESPVPNPIRTGAMIVRFTLPSDAAASLELFDVAGRRVVARDVGKLGAGHHALDLTAGQSPGAGIYFVRLLHDDVARVRRIVVLDE
jgi:hypothetical protein